MGKHLPPSGPFWAEFFWGFWGWRRKRQPTPVFLPGESHGRRSLAGYSSQGRDELSFRPAFSLFSFTFIKRLYVASHKYILHPSFPAGLSGRDLVTVLQGIGNPGAKTSAQECVMGSCSKESGWEMGEATAQAVRDVRSLPEPADQGSRWSAGRDHPHRAPIHQERQGGQRHLDWLEGQQIRGKRRTEK